MIQQISLPLHGVRVLELCNVAAGPYCGMLLADMGADVVKVEHPSGGDSLRQWPPLTDGFSENFAALNRNKRSITLDLKSPADLAEFRHLLDEADVLLENNRPGVMDRLGISYEDVAKLNDRLVYCSISAYGQTGPRAEEGGFDLTIQAMSGVMSVTGESGRAPVKCGVPLADFASGLYAAYGIMGALRQVQATGKGTHIDVPMLGATLAIAALQTSEYFGSGRDPVALGSAHPRNAPYQVFRCRDGFFAMAAGNNALWKAVCDTLSREDLLQDARFLSPSLRAANQAALLLILEEEFIEADAKTWISRLSLAKVPCAPINTFSEVLADPQVAHMEWIQNLQLPSGAVTRTFLSPLLLSGQRLPIRLPPPKLGEHNDELLRRRHWSESDRRGHSD